MAAPGSCSMAASISRAEQQHEHDKGTERWKANHSAITDRRTHLLQRREQRLQRIRLAGNALGGEGSAGHPYTR